MKKIGIVGASGYTGHELLSLIARHKSVEVNFASSEQEKGKPVTDVFPTLRKFQELVFCSVGDVK